MFQIQNILLIFGVFSCYLTKVLCLYENSNLTEVAENLELVINKTLAYEPPSDFSSYVETTSSSISGKLRFQQVFLENCKRFSL